MCPVGNYRSPSERSTGYTHIYRSTSPPNTHSHTHAHSVYMMLVVGDVLYSDLFSWPLSPCVCQTADKTPRAAVQINRDATKTTRARRQHLIRHRAQRTRLDNHQSQKETLWNSFIKASAATCYKGGASLTNTGS